MTLYFILCYLTLFNTKVRKKPRKILQVHEQNMFVIVTVADLTAQNLAKGVKIHCSNKKL